MTKNTPQDILDALAAAGLADFFSGCTGPHQNEYLKWISEAKKPETRQARIAKSVQMLSAKRMEEERRAKRKSRA
jgi:uncharacterized protein YdeI (YjbR/CyaY-like superfamily)